jgi:hypothetical protein
MHINGVTNLIINKADVLDEVGEFAVFVDNGPPIRFSNAQVFRQFVDGTLMDHSIRHLDITWSKTPHGI